MPMRFRHAFSLWSLSLATLTACLPGGRLPEMPVTKGSSLRAKGRAPRMSDGPFRVSFAGPEGDEVAEPQPQLVFSKPVRALGQKRGEPALLARFVPAVEGRWEWVGTSAAKFVATGGFQPATRYRLEVDAPKSLDGEVLATPVSLSFSTPRPHVVVANPSAGESGVGVREPVRFHFSQVIAREKLQSAVTIVDRAGAAVPFAIEQNGDAWNEAVQLKPLGAWHEGERLTVKIAAGVTGTIGDLPMDPYELTFDTQLPLGVESVECSRHEDGRCIDGASMTVSLSGDMRPSDLRARIEITPPVKLAPVKPADDLPVAYHWLSGDFRAGVKYDVKITPSERPPAPLPKPKKGGDVPELRPLVRGGSASFVFAPPDTGVHFSFSGTYVAPSPLAVAARAEETKVATAGVLPLDRATVMRLVAERDDKPWWELPGIKSLALPARASLKDPPAWASLKALTPDAGPALFGAKWEGFEGRVEQSTSVLQRTDLGLDARVTTEGTLVWITSLTGGVPLEGVAIEARDAKGDSVSATTDKDGVAWLTTTGLGRLDDEKEPHSFFGPRGWMVLFAQKGDDWIYRRVDVPRAARLKGALFTDRGLYRPGETAHLKGVVRRPTSKGLLPIDDRDVELELVDPDGRATRATARLGAFGTWDHTFATTLDGPTGRYTANARVDGELVASEHLRIMDYRPSSFSVDARLDKREYVRGETAACAGTAKYFYGGSAGGSRVTAWLHRQRTAFQVPGLTGFTIDEQDFIGDLPVDRAERGATLDAAGKQSFDVKLVNASQRGPELFSCDVTVTDASFDRVASSTAAVVHPGEVYVALQDQRWGGVFPGQTLEPKVLTVTPAGERRRKSVHVELVRHNKDPKRWGRTLPGVVVASCDVETGKDPRSCALRAPPGPYDDVDHFIERASLTDPAGVISSSVRLFPSQPPRPTLPPKPRVKQKPRPEAKLDVDKETYERGETAHLKATSPFASGHMLFTVEREGLVQHRVVHVDRAPVDLDVPIDAATAPFVHATATFVSPLSDHTIPRHVARASAMVRSGWAANLLDVAIKPSKAQASPGEELDIDVDVHTRDGRGVLAEVTLYAADEGTLTLAGYRIPEPLDRFFQARDVQVVETATRDALGGLFDWEAQLRDWGKGFGLGSGHGRLGGSHKTKPPQIRMGATSVDLARRKFDQGAFFLPKLTTDDRGHLRAHVTLPESLTTYRVMAFAVTKAAEMGSAEVPVVTQMPLQVRPVLPRAIRAGDKFVVGAMAANNGAMPLDATVSIAVDGLALEGPASRSITLAPGASERIVFDVAAERPGRGKVSLKIASGRLVDAAELPVDVATPVAMETAALYGKAEGRVDEQLAELASVRPDVGSLDLTLSASPLAGLGAGLEQLVNYPYGCTEQTTSRLVPLLSLRPLAASLGVRLPDDLPQASAEAVRRIIHNQRPDGSFGLWPNSKDASPWLSAYATWGLGEASRHGVSVEKKALALARGHLLRLLGSWGDGPKERATAPFALDVLTEAVGHDDVDAASLFAVADQLFRVRGEMPLFSRAHLLHAMGKLGSDAEQQRTLVTELTSSLHIDGPVARVVGADDTHASMFDSSARTAALILRALVAVSPQHALVTPLALGLVQDRSGGTWRTTQETAWALLALDAYRVLQPAAPHGLDGDVRLGDASVFHHVFTASPDGIAADAQRSLPMSLIAGPATRELSFVGKGGAPVYYQARLRFAPRELPTDDVASGFELHRRYFLLPSDIGPSAVQRGDHRVDSDAFVEGALVLVELDLSTTSTRRFVVIDDPLPGGFESVDPDLHGGGRWLAGYLHGRQTREEHRDDRSLFFFDELKPGSLRVVHLVRATVRGRFVAPPARVEEMYVPETFGRTGAKTVTIAAAAR